MIENKTVLAIIPARGGSKGVPRKNIRDVAGKPLIGWTIEEAKKSGYIDRLVVSTDDQEIADIAIQAGGEVPFLRPANLARDDSPGIAPVINILTTSGFEYDLVVLLQPTSPLRTVEDIDGAIAFMVNRKANACVSVVEPDKSPYWMYSVDGAGHLVSLLEGDYACRQDIPPVYALNGAVYVAEVGWLLKKQSFVSDETLAYTMPKDRSIDIDTEVDLAISNIILSGGLK
ncbi:MAG TPA: acylneuraminate cytidylyltransferase family protein [Desulfuromonadales bacterium]|nr:acylneuraminate cytidylyltransferase family protein [Desulfuromonadales bacterium]